MKWSSVFVALTFWGMFELLFLQQIWTYKQLIASSISYGMQKAILNHFLCILYILLISINK